MLIVGTFQDGSIERFMVDPGLYFFSFFFFFFGSSTSFPAAKTCLVLGFRKTSFSAVEGYPVAQAWLSSFLDLIITS